MILTPDTAFILLFASIVLALKPGPHMLAYTTLALDDKWRELLLFWFGSMIAGGIMYLLLLGGMSLIPESFGLVFIFIKSAGAILFLNMGILGLKDTLNEDRKASESKAEIISARSLFNNAISGFLLVLGNPYVIIFILTAIPAMVGSLSFTLMDIAIIYGIVIGADIIIVAGYCVPLLFIRNFLSDKLLRWARIGSSVSMIIIAIILVINMLNQYDLYKTGLLG
jgi:threonine/homoserine/homoserine lactone efflux protein